MNKGKLERLMHKVRAIEGHLQQAVGAKVTYNPDRPLEMALEAYNQAQPHVKAALTMLTQIGDMLENEYHG